MDVPRIGSEADNDAELDELRKRAYGPHPDIEDDPAALARLIELEATQNRSSLPVQATEATGAAPVAETALEVPAVAETAATDESSPPKGEEAPSAPTPRWRLIALSVGTAIALTGVLTAVVVAWEPPPDAVLHPTGTEPDGQLLTLLVAEAELGPDTPGASEMQIDLSTLRAFGTYREVEVWSAVNAFGSPCVIGVHRATDDVIARQCMPSGAVLFMDVPWDVYHGEDVRRALPEGEVLRFFLRPDAVDVHELVSEGAG